MTQEEILDYNKKCVELLGWRKTHPNIKNWHIYVTPIGHISYNKMLFHSDWNWIMEVINEILKIYRTDFYLDFDMPVSDTFTVSIGSDGKYNSRGESNVSSKEAVVQAINQFLIWYNENNNNRQSR